MRLLVMIVSIAWFSGAVPTAVAEEVASPVLQEPQRTRLVAPLQLPVDFELVSHDGRRARFSELRGQPTLVFFGFTNCQSVCPAAMQKLRQVRRSLDEGETIPRVALVSVDGDRDTPAVMKEFLAPFGPGFVGFTGPPAEVRPIADGFKAIFFKGGPVDTEGGYDVEHTSQTYLVDAGGRLRATFYNAPIEDMVAVVRHVR